MSLVGPYTQRDPLAARGCEPGLGARDEPRLRAADLRAAEDECVGSELLDDLDPRGDPFGAELQCLRPQAEHERRGAVHGLAAYRYALGAERDAAVLERHFAEVHRRRTDEAGDEAVARTVVEIARRPALLQASVVEDRDAVAERHRFRLVVRHVDGRDPEIALKGRDVGAHLHTQLRVEVRQRLVHQEDARLADDRAAHRDPLTLAARKLCRLAVEVVLEPEPRGHLSRPALALALLHLGHLQREGDVLRDGQVRIERVVLEDHRNVTLLRGQVGDVAVADQDAAGVYLLETGEHAQRRRFP